MCALFISGNFTAGGSEGVIETTQTMVELCHERKKLFLICLNTIPHHFPCPAVIVTLYNFSYG